MFKNLKIDTISWLKFINIKYHFTMQNKMSKKQTINIKTSGNEYMLKDIYTLSQLQKIINNIDQCSLKSMAKNTVFGEGIENAPILVIGEAPGKEEDRTGKPFCGESGQLLNKMLKIISIDRKINAYFTNIVFWRPPANRKPTSQEITICKPYIEKYISIINPKIIILVGATAASSILETKKSISEIKTKTYKYTNQYLNHNIHTTAIFHPSYLLRQPHKKKESWFDLIKIKHYINSNVNIKN